MIPANTKLLVGNLNGVSDTQMLTKNGENIAIDVPLSSLNWNINVDLALPKMITSRSTNLPIDVSQIYARRYFNQHACTDSCEKSFNSINNSKEEIYTFVKGVLEERKYMNPMEMGEAAEKTSIEKSYLNALGKAASVLYKTLAGSGLDTLIRAKISSKFHLGYCQ